MKKLKKPLRIILITTFIVFMLSVGAYVAIKKYNSGIIEKAQACIDNAKNEEDAIDCLDLYAGKQIRFSYE